MGKWRTRYLARKLMMMMTDMGPEVYSLVLLQRCVRYCGEHAITAVIRKLHPHWRKEKEVAVERYDLLRCALLPCLVLVRP